MLNDCSQCPRCRCAKIYTIRRGCFRCSACRYDFTATSRTAMHARKKPLDWYEKIIALNARGLNALQISKRLKSEYKAVWYFLKRRELSERDNPSIKTAE